MKKVDWLFLVSVCVSGGLAVSSGQAEILPPEIGQTLVFECTEQDRKYLIRKIAEVENGIIRLEWTRKGKAAWSEKPVAAVGLTLAKRTQIHDGKGVYWMSLDDDVLAEYAQLKPGSVLKFNVRARHDKARWEYGYKVEIGQPKTVKHELFGEIQVIPVTEKRRVFGGRYSSERSSLVYPEKGIVISFIHKDSFKKTRDCALSEIR